MSLRERGNVVSSFTIIKGVMLDETYAICVGWDFDKSVDENLASVVLNNTIGSQSQNWLRDVRFTIRRRYDFNGPDRALVVMAKNGIPIDVWKPLTLWHLTRDEFLVRDFLTSWLYNHHAEGALYAQNEEVQGYLKKHMESGVIEQRWTERTTHDVANCLLRIAVQYGLMRGTKRREFISYHLPDQSFIYLLHAITATEPNALKAIHSKDWRLFMLDPALVEQRIMRLHQFRELSYEVAGSVAQLSLPCDSALAYAQRMTA